MSDILSQQWACLTCNAKFPVGEVVIPASHLACDPWPCPRCGKPTLALADGATRETGARAMATIWKAELQAVDVQQVMVPAGSEMLCAREQHERVCVWFRCDPSAAKEPRTIAIVGTGHSAPEPDEGRYLGTASLRGGDLMFHVFERRT